MPVDAQLAENNWLRYIYIRDLGHMPYIIKANKCNGFFLGEQWEAVTKSLLDQQRRPALTINKILATISNIMGDQIQTRSETTFKPTHAEGEDVSHVLELLYKQISATNSLDWKESEVFADGIITSRGFFDVRLGFKRSLQGEIEVSVLNPANTLIDPDGEEYDPDTWKDVFVTKWLAPNDVELLYSKEDAEYLRYNFTNPYIADIDSVQHSFERFGGIGHYPTYNPVARDVVRNIRVLERQYKKLAKVKHFVDSEVGDMRPIPEDWDHNRIAAIAAQYHLGVIEKMVERIRWTVTAGNVVLHDDWSPYKHFTVVPYFPYFRRGRTMGIVENLLDPQELLNKVSSQELHIVNTTANSGYIVKQGGLRNMTLEELETRGAQTGVVIEMDDVKNLEKIQPNQIPTGIERISYKAEEHIKTISNVDNNALGQDREDVAAKAIKAKRERGAVNQLKVMDNLNYTRKLLARNIVDIIQEYYTEPRIYRITFENPVTAAAEKDNDDTANFISVNEFDEASGKILNDLTIGSYDVVVTNQPSKDTIEESEFEQAVALRQLGIAIPDDVIISHSLLREKKSIIERMAANANSAQAQQQAALTQQAQQSQVELLQAEVDEKKANALQKTADAQAKAADMVAENGPDGQGGNDLMSQVMQNHHEAMSQDKEHGMKREEMAHETSQSQLEHQQEIERLGMESAKEQQATSTTHAHEAAAREHEHKLSMEEQEQSARHASKMEETKSASAVKLAKMKPKPKPAGKK